MQYNNSTRKIDFSFYGHFIYNVALSATIFIFLLFSITFSHAQSYIKCWKNDQGLTECGNRIPREYYSKEVRFIDTRGITRKVKERDKTAEELAIEKENQRILDLQLTHKKELAEYDIILLKTYLTVDDLLAALDSKINILDSRTTLLQSIITTRKKQFDELVKKAADIERSGRKKPKNLQERLHLTRSELRNLQSQFKSEHKDALKIQKTYTHDVERFMITSANRMYYGMGKPGIARKFNAVRMSCSSVKQCNSYWNKARNYIKQYSTTPIRYSSNNIIVTDIPIQPHDIAMGLTYLDKKDLNDGKNNNYIIFQLRCHQGREGQEYCKDDNVSNILREFKSEMYY
jgi:hypothetical protein